MTPAPAKGDRKDSTPLRLEKTVVLETVGDTSVAAGEEAGDEPDGVAGKSLFLKNENKVVFWAVGGAFFVADILLN